MYGRTYLAAHWLSDTVEGALVGGGIGLLLWWMFEPLLDRDRGRPLRLPWRSEPAGRAEPDGDDANAPAPSSAATSFTAAS